MTYFWVLDSALPFHSYTEQGDVPLPIPCCTHLGLKSHFCVTFSTAGYSSRRVQSPGSKSNDTLSGISSIEPSKHSSSSHSLASVRTSLAGLGGVRARPCHEVTESLGLCWPMEQNRLHYNCRVGADVNLALNVWSSL